MALLSSPWVLMGIALVLHLATYVGTLMTHNFDVPQIKIEEEVEEIGIEEILESRADAHNWYFKTEEIDKYVEELKERESALDTRQSELDNLEAHLEVEREELVALKREIERRHKALSDEIMIVRKNEINNLRTLANSYSNISPTATVAIFEEMDQALVVKIMALMKPDVVALIFEELAKNGANDPASIRKAADLSEELRLHYKEKDE
jgi:flagellar motility protein MotE (MotC chaperone)